MSVINKVIVVEGKSDKMKLQEVLSEPVHIICTNGTMGIAKMDALLDELTGQSVYVMTDADKAGKNIRSWFKRHLSECKHIYIDPTYGEVGRCPSEYLAKKLMKHEFEVKGLNIEDERQQFFTFSPVW